MSQENHITLRGFITSEPKFRQTSNTQTAVTEIRVGSTPRRLNRETGEWQDLPTSYFTVKCWRRLAVNAKGSLHKGDMVVVRGKFYLNTWVDNQQQQRSALEIEADSIGHDLAYGHTIFTRGGHPQQGNWAGGDAGELNRQDLAADGGEPDEDYAGYPGDPDAAETDPAVEGLTSEYAADDAVPVPF